MTVYNPVPNNKSLNLSKFKAFIYDRKNMAQDMESVFERIENIEGKE